MNKKTLIYLLSFFFSLGLSAQDSYRYTYFDMAQVSLNPALAGGFEGTARFGGLIREQDNGVKFGQYQSPILYIDAPLIRGLRKQDWIGFGFSMQFDEAVNNTTFENADGYTESENTNIVNNTTIGGLSYHFAFDKKRKNVLAIGFQTSNSSTYFKGISGQTNGSIIDFITKPGVKSPIKIFPALQNKDQKKSNNLGYTIGAVFTSKISKTTNYKVGLSVANIGKNNGYSIIEGGASRYNRNLKFITFGKYRTELASGLILEPRVFFEYMDPFWQGSAQVLAGLKLKKPTSMILYGGLGYNPVNGAQFLFGADIKDIKVVFSFDLNLTDKTAVSGAAGAVELGASYILKIQKRPNPDPVLVCPNI